MFIAVSSAAQVTVHWGWVKTQTFTGLPNTGSKLTSMLEGQSVVMDGGPVRMGS